jgi:hypothetical protein
MAAFSSEALTDWQALPLDVSIIKAFDLDRLESSRSPSTGTVDPEVGPRCTMIRADSTKLSVPVQNSPQVPVENSQSVLAIFYTAPMREHVHRSAAGESEFAG